MKEWSELNTAPVALAGVALAGAARAVKHDILWSNFQENVPGYAKSRWVTNYKRVSNLLQCSGFETWEG